MASIATYALAPGYRDSPPLQKTGWAIGQVTWIIVAGLGIFALLAWALNDLNGFYLAFAGAFVAVEIVGTFVWPIARAWQQRGRAEVS